MNKRAMGCLILLGWIALLPGGCVERTLTINTEPSGALVVLNDEQIGESPVTVSFNWYGDYGVRLRKEGYQTLDTHRRLKAPWFDWFPLDFFAEVLYPGRIVDTHEWTFDLAPKQPLTREELLKEADALRRQID